MDALAAFEAKIKENQDKLNELEQRRKANEEESKKRKLEEEKELIKEREAEKIKHKRKKLNQSKARCTIETNARITALCTVLQLKSQSGSQPNLFKDLNGNSFVICAGTREGMLQVWDALNNFSLEITMPVFPDGAISCIKEFQGTLDVAKESQGANGKIAKSKALEKNGAKAQITQSKVEKVENVEGFGKPMIAITAGCDIYIVSTESWSVVHHVQEAHENEIQTITFMTLSSGQFAFTCSLDHAIRVWHASTWRCLCQYSGHTDAVLTLCPFVPVGEKPFNGRLCSGSDDSTIQVWDVESTIKAALATNAPDLPVVSKKAEHVLDESTSGHSDFVCTLCTVNGDPANPYLVSGSADFSIRVWNQSWQCVRVLETDKFATKLAWAGTTLYAATRSGADFDECSLEFWSVSSPAPIKWQIRPQSLNIPLPSDISLLLLNISDFRITPPEGKQGTGLAVLSASEEWNEVHAWAFPIKLAQSVISHNGKSEELEGQIALSPENRAAAAPPAPSAGATQGPGASVVAPVPNHVTAAPSTSLAAPRSTAVGTYTGDTLAKRFISTMLELDNLSPDMTRLLQACASLGSPL